MSAKHLAPMVAALLCLPLANAAPADDQPTAALPVEIRATAEPATTTIGTPFRYTVEVASGADVEVVLAQPSERIGDFEIIDFGDVPASKTDGKSIVARWYELVGYSVGDHLLKSPPVQYRQPGEALKQAPEHEILVTVESLLAKEGAANDIRDIKGPEPFPMDWRPYYLAGGALALLVALGFVLHRILNRERRGQRAAPPKPAHQIAFEELERLRRRRLIEEGAFKEYYSTLSAIVRSYVEQRFGVRAPEMTTEEFLLDSARNGRLQSNHRALLGGFLSESDLVKFARHLPTIDDSERAYGAAKRFVDETAAGLSSQTGTPPEERAHASG